MDQKQAEKLPLPIIGLALGAMGLVLSWIPLLTLLSFSMAIVGLVLIGVSLYVNRENKKLLTWIGLGVTILTAVVSMSFHVTYANIAKEATAKAEQVKKDAEAKKESKAKEAKEKNSKATISTPEGEAEIDMTKNADSWTQKYFDALVVGEPLTGAGGAKMKDIVAQVGEPSFEMEEDFDGVKVKAQSWFGFTDTEDIVLGFMEQDNGDWLLMYKSIEADDEENDEE